MKQWFGKILFFT